MTPLVDARDGAKGFAEMLVRSVPFAPDRAGVGSFPWASAPADGARVLATIMHDLAKLLVMRQAVDGATSPWRVGRVLVALRWSLCMNRRSFSVPAWARVDGL
eukprot:5241655-Prorocentrum_lima.AAC.1